jgi:lipoate-protein ligase B
LPVVKVVDLLGRLTPYAEGWQEMSREELSAVGDDALVLLEHAPVFTLGSGIKVVDATEVLDGSTEVVRVRRGGAGTWHGPGQLVAYPVLDLRRCAANHLNPGEGRAVRDAQGGVALVPKLPR